MSLIQRLISIAIAVVLAIAGKVQAGNNLSECGGVFRIGHECSMASDGNWTTSAVPDAYGDSVYVIENEEVPAGILEGYWRFKVLRNSPTIEVRVHYWDYDASDWSLLYEAPVNLDYATYTIQVPPGGLAYSPLRIRTSIKNAFGMSGEYVEGVADWVVPDIGYECQGVFRSGHECRKAVDGDTLTSAVPDAYGDSIDVIEYHEVPNSVTGANWHFRVLRNTNDIEIRASYWNCVSGSWDLLYEVPVNLEYADYVVSIPANALMNSQLKTKIHVKNASTPLLSGEYCEGQMDWVYGQPNSQVACQGTFREGHECIMAADGDWASSAVPNAYGDSVNVIESYRIPIGTSSAVWKFRVLRNTLGIEIAAYFWSYASAEWSPLYMVPLDLNYCTYTLSLPPDALLGDSLIMKMTIKNAITPAMSGEYCEGVVDWVFPEPHLAYEGCFRLGHEDQMATDGDWMTSAVPDNYNDSIFVAEEYYIPLNSYAAFLNFRVLRNDPAIEIKAYFFNYGSSAWQLLLEVPVNLDYSTYSVPLPPNALLQSPLLTRISIKNASAMSGEYFESAADFMTYMCGDADGNKIVTISDPVYLINYIFAGGAAPNPLPSGDPDCNGIVTISDAVYLINYIFAGGPAPCANCGLGASKLVESKADLSTGLVRNGSKNDITVNLDASAAVRAVRLDFKVTGDVHDIQVMSSIGELQLFSGTIGSEYRVGLIDLTGTAAIPAGLSNVAVVSYEGTGELSIASATVVDNDAAEMAVTIGKTKLESILPIHYELAQNQPNPFNPSTDISFSLPKADRVRLFVYNILGEEIAVLVDEVKAAGVHRVTWDGKDKLGRVVASGVYFYRLLASDFSQSRKMLLLK